VFRLPNGTREIQSEGFAGIAAQRVILPEGITAIRSKAFANCNDLLYVNLPESLTSISADAFEGCDKLCLICVPDSYGEFYATKHGINYITQE